MNSRGECGPRGRRADRIAESLARDVRELEEREEAHLAALHILRTRLARVEAVMRCAEPFCRCGQDRVFVPTHEIRAALAGTDTNGDAP